MNCRSFREILVDFVRDPQFAGANGEVLAHLKACDACSREAQQQADLSALLKRYRDAAENRTAPESLEHALVAQVRRRNRKTQYVHLLRLAAVLAVIALMGWFYRAEVSHFSKPETEQAAFEPTMSREQEMTTDFIPLYDSAGLRPAQIVRVRMNAASLQQFGFSVEDNSADQAIVADVVLSEEGTPQAIRLVRNVSYAK